MLCDVVLCGVALCATVHWLTLHRITILHHVTRYRDSVLRGIRHEETRSSTPTVMDLAFGTRLLPSKQPRPFASPSLQPSEFPRNSNTDEDNLNAAAVLQGRRETPPKLDRRRSRDSPVCYSVVTVLLHCCYTVVTLLLHCCYTVVTLLLHCCNTVVTLLLHCCYTVVTLLSHC
jgi:hypothetical protein